MRYKSALINTPALTPAAIVLILINLCPLVPYISLIIKLSIRLPVRPLALIA